jgi:BirA family biotin operon repressor/biotin-[acetyl-CoA-carboxylase] ligase
VYGNSRKEYFRQSLEDKESRFFPPLEVFDILDSTMDIEPPTLPYIAAALTQRKGRGRTGQWISPRGGAWLTIFIRVTPSSSLPVAIGGCLAVHLEKLVNAKLNVKWPNDIIAHGKKLAGVLIEHRGGILKVGVGVNVYNKPPSNAISLSMLGYRGTIAKVYLEIVKAVTEAITRSEYCIEQARLRDALLNCKVRIDLGGRIVEGLAKGIDFDGSLRVDDENIYCCHILSYECE